MDTNYMRALREAFASASSKVVILDTIELEHPDYPSSVFLINDKKETTLNLENGIPVYFFPSNFKVVPPSVGDTVQDIVTVFDTNDAQVRAFTKVLGTPESYVTWNRKRGTLHYRIYLEGTRTPQLRNPISLSIVGFSMTRKEITITSSFVDVVNRSFLSQNYNTKRFPALADFHK